MSPLCVLVRPWRRQRVCGQTQGYVQMSKFHIAGAVLVGVIFFGVGNLGGCDVCMYFNFLAILGIIGSFMIAKNREVACNQAVDAAVHAVCHEFTQRSQGQRHIAFCTAHTGTCKPKHAVVKREIWIGQGGY